MTENFNSLYEFFTFFPDEESCIDYFKKIRWRNKPICVQCESKNVYQYNKNIKLLKCADCTRQFRVTSDTVFENSNLPLRKWFLAFYLITSRKKEISANSAFCLYCGEAYKSNISAIFYHVIFWWCLRLLVAGLIIRFIVYVIAANWNV